MFLLAFESFIFLFSGLFLLIVFSSYYYCSFLFFSFFFLSYGAPKVWGSSVGVLFFIFNFFIPPFRLKLQKFEFGECCKAFLYYTYTYIHIIPYYIIT